MSIQSTSSEKLEKLLNAMGVRMMPPPRLQDCLRPHVNLTFDLLHAFPSSPSTSHATNKKTVSL